MTNIDSKRETNFAVTLAPCHLKENTYIARVPRKTITSDQLLDLVVAHNQGIDRYQVAHSMELLKKEILEQAALGFAVDIIEICKLYIAPISAVRSLNPEAETVTGFEARFSVNETLKETLKGVTAAAITVVDSTPQISQIENPMGDSSDGALKATFSARLKGKKLKVGGKSGGIFFIPSDGENRISDEAHWTKVPENFITKNTDTTLEFHIPRTLETEASYFIAVRTQMRGNTELKTAVTGYSKIAVKLEA
ncbi:MAG: DUF4469 domain-containing protein [Treponemataceae bacterium]|nr:DUF4469 domain-containing protein [Treponemataceae bacterium]